MTDRLHNNRLSAEPGHRYVPRSSGSRIDVKVHTPEVVARGTDVPRNEAKPSSDAFPQRQISATKPARPRQHRSLVLKRKGLGSPVTVAAPATTTAEIATPKRRYSRFHPANAHPALVFMGAAVLAAVLVFGGGMLLFRAKKDAADKYTLGSAPATLGASTTQPNGTANINEAPPTSAEFAAYRTPAGDPRYLKIPKLQLNARILAMDADRDGLPATPQNIYDAGWFVRGAKPGTNGISLLNGQAIGPTKPGVFNALESLVVGDIVQLERGDGKVIAYKVAKIEQYDPAKINTEVALRPAETGKTGLNLLAANGRYNVKTNTFEKRLIVRTIQQ